ncbi:MAG: orotidine-5'-phosphate decarboxylase [Elusimicrobiota bacterium]
MAELVLALDVGREKALDLIEKTSSEINYFKVGQALFAEEPQIINKISGAGKKVILDLKYCDIPSVIALAVKKVTEKYNPFALTLHVSGGRNMLIEAVRVKNYFRKKKRPLLFGVTVLTSLNIEDLKMLGINVSGNFNLTEHTVRLSKFAMECGLDGVVCSGLELKAVKAACGSKFLTLVPGLSISNSVPKSVTDQKRTFTLKEAAKSGGDYLVLGRTITSSENPQEAVRKAKREIQ